MSAFSLCIPHRFDTSAEHTVGGMIAGRSGLRGASSQSVSQNISVTTPKALSERLRRGSLGI
jgi:hypothetical protein